MVYPTKNVENLIIINVLKTLFIVLYLRFMLKQTPTDSHYQTKIVMHIIVYNDCFASFVSNAR